MARKPDPTHLRAALQALGTMESAAIMIGDNEHDVAMAKAAGVPVILVRYGYHRVPLEALAADIQIASFDALPQAIAQIGS